MSLQHQIIWLFILSIPIACVAWTVTHEAMFSEVKEFCAVRSKTCKHLWQRKFFYLFTCEYCISHYVTIFFLILTQYTLLIADWRGFLIGGFSLVWIANFYMSIYAFIKIDTKKERIITRHEEKKTSNQ